MPKRIYRKAKEDPWMFVLVLLNLLLGVSIFTLAFAMVGATGTVDADAVSSMLAKVDGMIAKGMYDDARNELNRVYLNINPGAEPLIASNICEVDEDCKPSCACGCINVESSCKRETGEGCEIKTCACVDNVCVEAGP